MTMILKISLVAGIHQMMAFSSLETIMKADTKSKLLLMISNTESAQKAML